MEENIKLQVYLDKINLFFKESHNNKLSKKEYQTFILKTNLRDLLLNHEDEESFWQYCSEKQKQSLVNENRNSLSSSDDNYFISSKIISESLTELLKDSITADKPEDSNLVAKTSNINNIVFDNNNDKLINILKRLNMNEFLQLRRVFNELDIRNKLVVNLEDVENLLTNTNFITMKFSLLFKILFLMSTENQKYTERNEEIDRLSIKNRESELDDVISQVLNDNENSNIDLTFDNIPHDKMMLEITFEQSSRLIAMIEQTLLSDQSFLDNSNKDYVLIEIPNNFENLVTEIENLEKENREFVFLISTRLTRLNEDINLFKSEKFENWEEEVNERLDKINHIMSKLETVVVANNEEESNNVDLFKNNLTQFKQGKKHIKFS